MNSLIILKKYAISTLALLSTKYVYTLYTAMPSSLCLSENRNLQFLLTISLQLKYSSSNLYSVLHSSHLRLPLSVSHLTKHS